ncbi:MAG TPA: SdrD B-like domain-containing protein, partial [Kiritimatiellia bacterium]|nr:SdrD B-like domain-containing protein [Kiritimatiellia bacterium]
MSRFQRSSFWFAFILIVTAGLGRAQNIVQEFFIPLPEEQVRGSLLKLFTSTGTTFDSVISVVISSDGTKFVYDHWEDGYEVDLDNPVQSTTQVWGDGNNANGIPPGFVNDPAGLPVGTVLPLRNLVTLPRNPSQIRYDGRDRIGATKAVVVSRAAWATSPGSVLAGAVEVSSVLDYGTEFFAPVGENVSASQMFEVVDLFVMAAENGTTVNIDKDANGSFETVANLNRGESYRVNGGVLRGARVVANKPIQAHLITGDIGANYESRWYTLYPFEQWTDTYYTPVGSAANGHETYIFAYNPGTSALPVQVTTQIGTTNLSVAANGSVQYLMPVNSGAKFQSTNGAPFFAIATVGARPSANNVHDWGFSLVPEGNLTPIAQVGWGPGSSDLSQNGSPVWVTAVGATTLYVDYNGDKLGPFTDSNGDGYDISYPMALLQSRTIYDPDKDQTGMRIYTLDGTLITAAWGQDPAVAGAGNPFLDLGTTVLPFPEAVIRKTSTLIVDNPPAGISTNDILEYAITIDNNSLVVLGNVIVLDTPPPSLLYITNSASRDFVAVPDDVLPDTLFPFDEGGYVIPIVPRGGSTTLRYHARILSSGTIANGATLGGDTVVVTNIVEVPPPEGAAACNLAFTDGSGAPIIAYSAGSSIYVTLNDADANTDTSVVNTIAVNVQNLSNGDVETITLSELSANTNVFRNLIALPSSTSSGLLTQDGTLNVGPGHTLSVSYTDPVFNDFCSDTVLISTPSETKVLYLSTDGSGSPDQDLDRIDPVASGDSTTATSVVLSASSSAITVLNTTSRGTNEGASALTTLVIPHVTSNAANRLMLVGFSAEDDNTGSLSVTNVRYVAVGVTQTMTRVFARASSQEAEMELWSLIAPTIGSGTVTVFMADGNANDGDAVYVGVTTFSGVNQTTPFRTTNTAVGTTSPASVIVTSAVNDLVFDLMALDDARSATAISGQTVLWNEIVGSAANDGVRASASVRDGAAPRVTNSWTISADSWVSGGVSIQPAQLEHMSSTSVTSLTGNISVPHVVGSGDNRLMMVGVSWKPDGNTNITVARVRSGNTTNALTLVGTRLGNDQQVNIYSLLAPSVGSATVDVTFAAAHKGAVVGVSTFAGVNQSTPLGAFASNTGDSTAPSVSVVSAADDLVFDTVTVEKDATLSVGPAQVSRWLTAGNVNEVRGGGSTEVASNLTTTMSWTLSTSKKWVIGGVAIKPAPAGGGNSPTATFTQTPVLCSDLELPAGGVVTVTNFIAVTSGSMPANPDITAVLRYGATVVATMNPPTYTAANSNLTWTAVIPSDVTVPAGEALSLDVQSAEAGVVFHLLYDSSNKPSKISLPVTTVISVDSVAVYDAPYPGGSIVPSANNGNTLYIRTTVSDPFGAYDITGLDLDIDGPGVADDVFVSLNDANVVASNACSKTYEYVWNTGATEGNYSIAATAHEGSEGITDTRATSIPLSSLDLGTPCSIAFTFGDNGPATNQFATNATICVRVTDLDQNTNSLTVDTLFAVLTSSSGDVEPLVLTETATNSGIFTACIPSSALPGFVSSNGVISAPAGSLLALDYVDPDDPTDPCSAVAVVPAAPGTPGLSLTKTLIAPADGQAVLGEGIQFRLRAVNTGSTVLNPVSVTDTFANVHMAYNFATPTPNSVGAGSLVWTNIGPMSPGDTVDIFVNFTALSVADPSTNIAIANAGGGVVSTGTSTVIISDPAITVNKVVLSPVPGPAPKGSDVVFQITITNVGSSAVTVLPLEDTYSGACFSFVSASPSPDGTGFGSLLWDDLTGAGSLAPGGSITVLVTLAATGGCNPAENVSPISYAVDEYGDPVPPVTSSATITTVAARISGFVYNDIDQSGTFTGGDVGLGGVTVRLFTDPNGDGDPSDGTLVGLLTTLANGSYEFLNLGTGTYVVVETDPLSFVSTGDTAGPNDNRIPVAVVSFISYDGNNFFDAQFPAIVVQKTVNGQELVLGTNGTPVTYAFVVSNPGSITLTNVTLTDAALGFTTNVGSLIIGQSKTVSVAGVISADLTNVVNATGFYFGTGTVNDTDTAIVDLIAPAIEVVKTVNGVSLVQGTNNAPVTYAFVVSNAGDVALTNVVVTDPLLSFTTNVGTLAVGQSVTVSVDSVISGDLTNTVAVTGEDPNGDEYADEDT